MPLPKHQIISLSNVSGMGPRRIRSLIQKYPQITSLKEFSKKDLCQIDGINLEIAENILRADLDFGRTAIENIHKIDGRYISYWDDEYPVLLQSIYDAPVGIFVMGEIPIGPAIAVVGTRDVTAYGSKMTEKLTLELLQAGFTIVSGFARGVDTVCHRMVLHNGGKTIAVLGNGPDICYPSENRGLRDMIIQQGVLISEFTPGTKPDAMNFPKRNRIISGLSLGTLVIEAGERSGALITAYNALDQNREVFALPGRADVKQAQGCLRLIQRGAKLVMNVGDILEELQVAAGPRQVELLPDLSPDEVRVVKILSADPVGIDDLCIRLKQDSPKVLAVLLGLELKNVVQQLPGKRFVRV